MPFSLTMPKLSPTMEAGTITKWRKKIGDYVKEGDVLFEVATDKSTVEHSALDSGYLRKILIDEGKEAIVNQPVAIFSEKADESIDDYKPEGIVSTPASAQKPPAKDTPSPGKPEEKRESSPSSMQQPAFVPEPPLENYRFTQADILKQGHVRASPLARKLAEERGIDLATVRPSGPNQRIVAEDVEKGQPKAMVSFGKRGVPTVSPGSFEEVPLSPIRKVIGQRLQEAKTFIPHFYVSQDVRCDALHSTREQLKTFGIKISFNDLVLKACAFALREHPKVNTGYDSVKQAIIQFQSIDISVAVNIEQGLITPIIRHADYKNVGELSAEMKGLSAKAKAGKLERHEYTGGSFTISNLGMYGVSEFTAILNPPQAAILAIAGIEERPVVEGKHVVVGKVMRLTLSADHRVIDGALAAEFLKTLQKFLENPAVLIG